MLIKFNNFWPDIRLKLKSGTTPKINEPYKHIYIVKSGIDFPRVKGFILSNPPPPSSSIL